MSNPNINPGAVETQQMRVVAPVGVSSALFRLLISLTDNSNSTEQRPLTFTHCIQHRWTSTPRPGRLCWIPTWSHRHTVLEVESIRVITQTLIGILFSFFLVLSFALHVFRGNGIFSNGYHHLSNFLLCYDARSRDVFNSRVDAIVLKLLYSLIGQSGQNNLSHSFLRVSTG